jgi:hypothetical protein
MSGNRSFELAKRNSVNSINKIVSYLSGVHNKYPEIGFNNYVTVLSNMAELYKKLADLV